MSTDGAFYQRALERIDRLSYVLAPAAIVAVLFIWGWRNSLGCAVGCLLSFVNFRLWKRLANSIGGAGDAPSVAFLVLRYLLLGTIIFVIIRYFEVNLLAVLAGLLVSVAAVICEILYELVVASHSA